MRLADAAWISVLAGAIAACDGGSTSTSGGAAGSGASTTTTGGAGAGGTSSGGTAGTGATTGGSGGLGGTGGMGGSTNSSTTSTTTGGGTVCTWAPTDPCEPGFYCKADNCGMGQCAPMGSIENGEKAPVCGCDGVTYWNDSIAKSHGMSIKTGGECGPSAAKQCGGFGGLPCPDAVYCNYALKDAVECNIADLGGTCWAMPKVCEGGVGFGPNTRQCGAELCKAECELIKADMPWYVDNTCPQ
ncbi:MAG: hypothetical protein IPK82_28380 [Polyangiaceae bacterium]|nr:hypothetical protein [Polyangiaceae bacterium]